MASVMEMFVPQMTLVEPPPRTSASDVPGLTFEKVASEAGSESLIGMPSSPTNTRLRFAAAPAKLSECMSPLLDEILSPSDLKKSPLLSDGASVRSRRDLAGLELGSYLTGEESEST